MVKSDSLWLSWLAEANTAPAPCPEYTILPRHLALGSQPWRSPAFLSSFPTPGEPESSSWHRPPEPNPVVITAPNSVPVPVPLTAPSPSRPRPPLRSSPAVPRAARRWRPPLGVRARREDGGGSVAVSQRERVRGGIAAERAEVFANHQKFKERSGTASSLPLGGPVKASASLSE